MCKLFFILFIQEYTGWYIKIREPLSKLSADLQREFPEIKGFSKANIQRMMAFYKTYTILSQAATKLEDLVIFHIPWFHPPTHKALADR